MNLIELQRALRPRSGVKFTCIAKKWLKIEDLSQGCLQQSIDSARHSRSPSAVLACELDAYRLGCVGMV